MGLYNQDTDELDVDALTVLLRSDLVAATKELIEIYSLGEVAEGECVPDELEDRLEVNQVDYDNEGDGNYMYAVLEFILDGVSMGFVRMTGTYSSWDSPEWDDDVTFVEPRQVVTTEYIAVDGSEDDRYDRVLDKHSDE